MQTVTTLMLLGVLLGSAAPAHGQAYIKTPLSKKTKKIKPGMSREDRAEYCG
jgi:hypothetical protein